MKKIKLLLLTLGCLSLFLAGCGAPRPVGRQVVTDDGGKEFSNVYLSKSRIAEIRAAFIGRTFVFKEDWYEYAVIDSDPLGGLSDPVPITTFRPWMESNNYRVIAAKTGTLAKISGSRLYRDGITFICETEHGNNAYITIINHRPWTLPFGSRNTGKSVQRDALKDDRITVAWIERNLTYHTMEFVENLPKVPSADLALPAPTQEPTLTPAPSGGAGTMTPTIGQFDIQADPPLVRNNQMLQLILEYEVQAAGQGAVSVIETRTLLLDGKTLPNYPKITSESRGNGRHRTTFQQLIPPRARAGTYVYQGEVCVADDCISRSKKFQVAP